MKLSILTPTYNSSKTLRDIYDSLLANMQYELEFEWLIMDDGSNDNTKEVINEFIKEGIMDIHYFYQVNQGKEIALNNLMQYITGDIILQCNANEYLASNAFQIINDNLPFLSFHSYALAFLKCDIYGDVSGKKFKYDNYRTTMFDLYYKDDIQGEKILLFNADIRIMYKHELEGREKHIPEDRMYYKMDQDYKVVCFNVPLIIGDLNSPKDKKDIKKLLIENPVGYLKYFTEILNRNMDGVLPSKRKYLIKNYILACYFNNQKKILNNLKDNKTKFEVIIRYIPVYISAWKYTKKYRKLYVQEEKRLKNNEGR